MKKVFSVVGTTVLCLAMLLTATVALIGRTPLINGVGLLGCVIVALAMKGLTDVLEDD